MMNSNSDEGDEMEMLLPWYAAGTLDAAATRKVEAWLAAHPQARKSVALIREELDETIGANESLGVPGAGARDRLMQAIAADAGSTASAAGIWQRVKAAWAGFVPAGLSPAMAFAGAAAGLVIMVQAVALGVLLLSAQPDGGGVRLASGEEGAPAAGTVLMVRFTEDARAGDIAALLKPLGATIVDGPKPGGIFKVRVAPGALPDAERTAIMEKLKARRDIVNFVAAGG